MILIIFIVFRTFKKEILLHSEKFFNESNQILSNKLTTFSKKLQATENNVWNKYKLIKTTSQSQTSKSSTKTESDKNLGTKQKEKIANLEIKIKLLEDNLATYKLNFHYPALI